MKMKLSARVRLLGPTSVAAVLALGVASSPALGATFTVNLSLPSSGTIGTAMAVTASGVDPTDQGALYLEIDAIPTTLTTTCPSGYLNGSQLASSTPSGTLVAFDQPETFDASGSFSNVNGYTPAAAGTFLFCAYTDDGAGDTLATASATTTITATAPSPMPIPTKPVNTTRPRVTRSGDTLHCSAGKWANAPLRYSYRWLVAGKVKAGAHGRTLGAAHKLRGHGVRCSVTASNSAGSATATSAAFTVH
jgi:hypothetical protein